VGTTPSRPSKSCPEKTEYKNGAFFLMGQTIFKVMSIFFSFMKEASLQKVSYPFKILFTRRLKFTQSLGQSHKTFWHKFTHTLSNLDHCIM
jgi:hypothetical protein